MCLTINTREREYFRANYKKFYCVSMFAECGKSERERERAGRSGNRKTRDYFNLYIFFYVL